MPNSYQEDKLKIIKLNKMQRNFSEIAKIQKIHEITHNFHFKESAFTQVSNMSSMFIVITNIIALWFTFKSLSIFLQTCKYYLQWLLKFIILWWIFAKSFKRE